MRPELSRGVRHSMKNLKSRVDEAEKLFLSGQFEQAAIEYTAVRASVNEMMIAINRFKREATSAGGALVNPEMENNE